MKGRVILVLFLFMAAMGSAPLWSTMIKYDLEQLSKGSEKIVIGKVIYTESSYLEAGKAIYTFVTIEVDEVIKGDVVAGQIVLRVPGGSVGDETMEVSHAPSFMIGEEVLVFVARQTDGQDVIYNAENGKYTIEDGIVVEEGVPLENFVLAIRAYLEGIQDQTEGVEK